MVIPIKYDGLAAIRSQDYSEQTAKDILSHKLEVWAYEQEVRAFTRDEYFIKVKVISIITGQAMSNQDFSFVLDLVNRINPKIEII